MKGKGCFITSVVLFVIAAVAIAADLVQWISVGHP